MFPDYTTQQDIAHGFKRRSGAAAFGIVIGATDCILIWILKPFKQEWQLAKCSEASWWSRIWIICTWFNGFYPANINSSLSTIHTNTPIQHYQSNVHSFIMTPSFKLLALLHQLSILNIDLDLYLLSTNPTARIVCTISCYSTVCTVVVVRALPGQWFKNSQ